MKAWQTLSTVVVSVLLTVSCGDQEKVYDKNGGMITEDKAVRTGLNWMELQFPTHGQFEVKDIKLITRDGKATSYNIEFKYGGFVIVSASYDAKPVMAYSESSSLKGADPLSRDLVDSFSKSISDGATEKATEFNRNFWDSMQNPTEDTRRARAGDSRVEPFIETRWGQSGGQDPNFTYNAGAPYVTDEATNKQERAPVGCAAVAFGQVLKFYDYPKKGVGSIEHCPGASVECSENDKVETSFYQTNYAWDKMPSSLNSMSAAEHIEAVSTLLYHIGRSIQVKYGYHGSGAQITNASIFNKFRMHFNMGGIETVKRTDYETDAWSTLITDEIRAGRPVILTGAQEGVGGHAYILDGVRQDDYVHVNWGWGGAANGYFDLENLIINGFYNFTEGLTAYINITPNVVQAGGTCNGERGLRCQDGLICALNGDINQPVDEFSSDEAGECLAPSSGPEDTDDTSEEDAGTGADAGTDTDTDTDTETDTETDSTSGDDPMEPVVESGIVRKGEWVHFGPYAFAKGIKVEMTGIGENDPGDADLYVRRDRQPNQYTFHCRPGDWGSNETCLVAGADNYFVAVYGYSDISSFTLVISDAAL